MLKSSKDALEKAINVLKGQTNLAHACGKRQGHVSYWLETGKLPSEHCLAVEAATAAEGDVVSRYELRSDVFGCAPPLCSQCGAALYSEVS